MALLSFEKEMERARKGWPFANGHEFDSWYGIWCEDCVHVDDCPLLGTAIFGRIPKAWDDVRPGSLNRWNCNEFEKNEGDPCTTASTSSQARIVSHTATPNAEDSTPTTSSSSLADISLRASTPPSSPKSSS